MALQGQGFFELADAQGLVYTRAGNFTQTETGDITNSIGNTLRGKPLDPSGNATGGAQNININGVSSTAQASTTVTIKGNLQSDAAIQAFDGTSFNTAFQSSAFTNTVRIFDSLGKSLGDALLTPTRIYAKLVLALVADLPVKGIAHITGGGLPGNLLRDDGASQRGETVGIVLKRAGADEADQLLEDGVPAGEMALGLANQFRHRGHGRFLGRETTSSDSCHGSFL